MFRSFVKIGGILILLIGFIGCGDAEKVGQVPPEELLQINKILDRWREGYETETLTPTSTPSGKRLSLRFRYGDRRGQDRRFRTR